MTVRVVKCPFCRDTWEHAGQIFSTVTKCWKCGKFYMPHVFSMYRFVYEAFRRTKGE